MYFYSFFRSFQAFSYIIMHEMCLPDPRNNACFGHVTKVPVFTPVLYNQLLQNSAPPVVKHTFALIHSAGFASLAMHIHSKPMQTGFRRSKCMASHANRTFMAIRCDHGWAGAVRLHCRNRFIVLSLKLRQFLCEKSPSL